MQSTPLTSVLKHRVLSKVKRMITHSMPRFGTPSTGSGKLFPQIGLAYHHYQWASRHILEISVN